MSEYRNYNKDFIIESDNYYKHISAMTGEQLHSKADIAAELAYRDDRIAELEQQNRELLAHVEKWKEVAVELGHLIDGVREGEYKPDSFTNQPLRILLNKTPTQSLQLLTEQEIKKIFIDGLKVGVDTRISGALPNGMTVNEVAHEYARNWSGADK